MIIGKGVTGKGRPKKIFVNGIKIDFISLKITSDITKLNGEGQSISHTWPVVLFHLDGEN